MSVVSVVCCQVEVSCDELITRPEESYRLWRVVVYDLETSRIGAPYIHDISSLRVNVYCYSTLKAVSHHQRCNKPQKILSFFFIKVSLTVNLSITLDNDQLDAQFFY